MASSTLSVPGAVLSYTTAGHGPLLLLIPGANGEGSIFQFIVAHLSTHFKICTYARRNYQPSIIQPRSDENKHVSDLMQDVDDAAALITHLSPSAPVSVLGTSAGAIVALALLQKHPERVRRLIAHEPPLTKVLGKEGKAPQGAFDAVYVTYKKDGWQKAVSSFAEQLASAQSPERQIAATLARPENEVAVKTFFESELKVYTQAELDFARLKEVARVDDSGEKLIMAFGKETDNKFFRNVAETLAERLAVSCVELPGGHLGYVSKPNDFARLVKIHLDGARARL